MTIKQTIAVFSGLVVLGGALVGIEYANRRAEDARAETRNICDQIENKSPNPRGLLNSLGFTGDVSSLFGTNEIPSDYSVRFSGPYNSSSENKAAVILRSEKKGLGFYLGNANPKDLEAFLKSLNAH